MKIKNEPWYEIHVWVESLPHEHAKSALKSAVESLMKNCYLGWSEDGKPMWRHNKEDL